jgi:hypothetical protein
MDSDADLAYIGSFPDLPENDYLDLDKKRQQAFADVAAGAVEE